MLEETYKMLYAQASCIGDWEKMSKSELANKYCDADDINDDIKKSQYYSALVLKYWYMISYMKNHTKGLDLDYEDYLYWLEESLNIAFKYRRWRDSSQQISENPNAPELIINRAIYSTQRRYYTYYATLKRVGDSDKVSIEDLLENRYSVDTALMTHDKHTDTDNVDVIISQLINKNKVFEALVIDCIAFGNTITEIKSNKNIKLQFSIKALIKSIESINNEYCLYFAEKYGLSLDYVKQVISDTITSKSHFTVRNKVKHCLKAMQYNEDVISLLC